MVARVPVTAGTRGRGLVLTAVTESTAVMGTQLAPLKGPGPLHGSAELVRPWEPGRAGVRSPSRPARRHGDLSVLQNEPGTSTGMSGETNPK